MSRMPFVNALDVEVHYVQHGPEDAARTVVFLHGFSVDHRMCLGTFEPVFAKREGWRRIYVDFPGAGKTMAPEWVASTDDVFNITHAAVNALVPGDYYAAGISYGGYIAAGLTAADPSRVKGLALLVPMMMGYQGRDVAVRELLWCDESVLVAKAVKENAVVLTRDSAKRTREQIEIPFAEADQAAVIRISERYDGAFPLLPPGGTHPGPTLVLTGRQDAVVGYNDQWKAYGQWPRATFVVADRGGHGVFVELPALTETFVSDWLDRIENLPPS